jgi:hypothetical protein
MLAGMIISMIVISGMITLGLARGLYQVPSLPSGALLYWTASDASKDI